jgi:hypothetical protein
MSFGLQIPLTLAWPLPVCALVHAFCMLEAMAQADFASLNSSGIRIPFRVFALQASAQISSAMPYVMRMVYCSTSRTWLTKHLLVENFPAT